MQSFPESLCLRLVSDSVLFYKVEQESVSESDSNFLFTKLKLEIGPFCEAFYYKGTRKRKSFGEANCILKMGNIWRSLWYAGIILTGGQGQKSERGVQFPFQRGGVNVLSGGVTPPLSTPKNFHMRHSLLFKAVRPAAINLSCHSYRLPSHLQLYEGKVLVQTIELDAN